MPSPTWAFRFHQLPKSITGEIAEPINDPFLPCPFRNQHPPVNAKRRDKFVGQADVIIADMAPTNAIEYREQQNRLMRCRTQAWVLVTVQEDEAVYIFVKN